MKTAGDVASQSTSSAGDGTRDTLFLPDFCGIRTVFAVVVVGELLAFVLALSPAAIVGDRWGDLALISAFIQWVALASAAVLCVARRWLRRLDNVTAGLVSYAAILAVTAAVTEASFRLLRALLPGEEVASTGHAELLLRCLAISAIVAAVVLRYLYVQHQWRTRVESEARARIQALQSRIRPHFLFNSMNTIASLTRSHPEAAEQIVEDLADLFRVTLGDASVPATLASELEVCDQYLRIEQQRLGARLQVTSATAGLPGDALLPALSLQPLLENAVYHGIEPAPAGGTVQIAGERDGDRLCVEIANSLDPTAAGGPRPGNRMAQQNVDERLRAFFGEGAGLEVHADAERYTVRLRFPYLTTAGAGRATRPRGSR